VKRVGVRPVQGTACSLVRSIIAGGPSSKLSLRP
jgi:hypothetical protein